MTRLVRPQGAQREAEAKKAAALATAAREAQSAQAEAVAKAVSAGRHSQAAALATAREEAKAAQAAAVAAVRAEVVQERETARQESGWLQAEREVLSKRVRARAACMRVRVREESRRRLPEWHYSPFLTWLLVPFLIWQAAELERQLRESRMEIDSSRQELSRVELESRSHTTQQETVLAQKEPALAAAHVLLKVLVERGRHADARLAGLPPARPLSAKARNLHKCLAAFVVGMQGSAAADMA